jgi:heptosyltransferase-2
MLDYAIYLLYRAGVFLLTLFPLPMLFALGQTGGLIAWLLLFPYRTLAAHNVQLAFGNEISKTEARQLVRRHFQRLGANLLCSVKFASMPVAKILERVRVENVEHIQDCLHAGHPLVFLLSHLGCWELCAQLLPHFIPGRRKSTVYQRMRNRYVDQHVRAIRGRFGTEVFERSEGFGQAIELLRQGGVVGILADQHAGDRGLWTPFFGRLASTTPLPALLAKRTGAQIIPFAIVTDGFARWRAVVEPPLGGLRETVDSLTARGNRVIEQQVRRNPADWFWVHDRWKTPIPNLLLARYRRGVFVPDEAALKPFRILIRSSNWLGDAAMSMPAVRVIKSGRPDAQVTVLAPEKIAALWREVREVDEVLALPRPSLWEATALLKRQAQFDVAVLFPNSLRSALEVFLAGVPRRVGFAGHARCWLLNQIPKEKEKSGRGIVHQRVKYLKLAAHLGADLTAAKPAEPIRHRRAERKLGLCPSAEYGPAKRWLPERFAKVANDICQRRQARWVLFGTASDAAAGAQIAEALGVRCENRIGQTTLEQLIAELRNCDLLLTNDTGTMHLAVMLGLPTVSIFGSTEPRLSGPMGPSHRIIRRHVECSPCFLRECPLDFRCMREITTAEVTAAVIAAMPPVAGAG